MPAGIIAACDKVMSKMGYRTTEEMREFLDGETLLAEAKFGREPTMMLAVTDRRLLTINYGGHRYHHVRDDIPYYQITTVQLSRHLYGCTMEINSLGARAPLRVNLSRSEAEELVAVIREHVRAVG